MEVGSTDVGLQVLVHLVPDVPLRLVTGQGLRQAVTEGAEPSRQNKRDVVGSV